MMQADEPDPVAFRWHLATSIVALAIWAFAYAVWR